MSECKEESLDGYKPFRTIEHILIYHNAYSVDLEMDLLRQLERILSKNYWRPIESAPLDTEILMTNGTDVFEGRLRRAKHDGQIILCSNFGYLPLDSNETNSVMWMPKPKPPGVKK